MAVGAGSEPVYEHAITWTPQADPELFGGLRQDLEEGYGHSVAFVVPPGVAWPLPAYELALMTAWAARDMGQDDVDVSVVTPESAPLEVFGVAGSAAVRADLDEAGVRVETDAYVEQQGREFVMQPGARPLEARRVVALPRAVGPAVPGLPANRTGFIPVDRDGRVSGAEHVWAAGDAIAFPVKQGGLAAQQADAAAASIAAMAGAGVDRSPSTRCCAECCSPDVEHEWLRHDVAGGGGRGRQLEARALVAAHEGRRPLPVPLPPDARAGRGGRPGRPPQGPARRARSRTRPTRGRRRASRGSWSRRRRLTARAIRGRDSEADRPSAIGGGGFGQRTIRKLGFLGTERFLDGWGAGAGIIPFG